MGCLSVSSELCLRQNWIFLEQRERGIWFSSWQNWLGLDYTAAAIAVTMFRFMMMSFLKLFR